MASKFKLWSIVVIIAAATEPAWTRGDENGLTFNKTPERVLWRNDRSISQQHLLTN